MKKEDVVAGMLAYIAHLREVGVIPLRRVIWTLYARSSVFAGWRKSLMPI